MRDEDGFLVGWGMGTAVFHWPASGSRGECDALMTNIEPIRICKLRRE
jgi:hypothetical protein